MDCDIKTWFVMPMFLLIVSYLQCFIHGESQQVPCMFIFGDSMSDNGNNNLLPTPAKANYEPYGIDFPKGPTGRFTNGRLTVDLITQFLGFEEFIPPFANTIGSDILKGVNYASAGAGIRLETSKFSGSFITSGVQIENHKLIIYQIARKLGSLEKARQHLNKCLYYVNMGRSDYLNNYFVPHSPTHIYSPEQYATVLMEELSLNLLALHAIGARKYVLCGMGLLGCLPLMMTIHATNGFCVEEMNANALIFNDKLKSLADNFNNKFSADSKFMMINSTAQDLKFMKDFPVANVSCCPTLIGGCIPHHKPCYNRSEYQFWDQTHPTEARNIPTAISAYNASNPSFTYPMDVKHLADLDINMEFELINNTTS